ncbi:acylphosphatase [Vibrio sp. FNV 38]|nr:acylphosphatase [Vibrio sp. FNV 38]
MSVVSWRFIVSGHVQGVGFRYHTCHEGLKLGLNGYARNLANGNVEVMATGDDMAIGKLEMWLSGGPRTASVDSVIGEQVAVVEMRGFEIQ